MPYMSSNSTTPAFQLKNVSVSFGGFPALHDISLSVGAGEWVALVGPSGAGKSTLLSLFNGMIQPSAGEMWVLGRHLARLEAGELRRLQRQVGVIYQQFHLANNLRVIHNVNAGHLRHWPSYSVWPGCYRAPWLAMRTGLALIRGIHEIIWGLIFVNIIGLDPLTAILAIAIPFGAITAKAFSEILDETPR